MDKISEDTNLFMLKLIMNYIPPKKLAILSTVHLSLQRNAASLFRTETRNSESQEIVDLDTSMGTAARSADFSDTGRCYFFLSLPYLSTVTEELNLSSSFIDNTGLRILSSWCTNLYSLILQRCQYLDNDALGYFSTGFSSLLCVDLSNNTLSTR